MKHSLSTQIRGTEQKLQRIKSFVLDSSFAGEPHCYRPAHQSIVESKKGWRSALASRLSVLRMPMGSLPAAVDEP